MDKKTLEEYKDAAELIKEWKLQLNDLETECMVQDIVKTSMKDYPFAESHTVIKGRVRNEKNRKKYYEIKEKIRAAEQKKEAVEKWMESLNLRQQRIVRCRVIEGMSWREVADEMGRRATEYSVKKEYERLFKHERE